MSHEFVLQLASGVLPNRAFGATWSRIICFYPFSRAWGLAIYKSDTLSESAGRSAVAATLDVEIGLHIDYCRGWVFRKERWPLNRGI